jgi:hypothetical protein
MQILGYGEDALTLWAIKSKLDVILEAVKDSSDPSMCQVFFRPSFGRRGGDSSPQFGEFDFILLSKDRLYLGESKWIRSSEKVKGGILELRDEQKRRHKVFKFYVEKWAFGDHSNWREFTDKARLELESGDAKPLAPENSLLATNLKTVLRAITEHYASRPDIRDVLLYFYDGETVEQLPQKASDDFDLVCIDYSQADTLGNFIRIEV